MDKSLTFEQFLASTSSEISMYGFLINLVISGILAIILSKVYVRYGKALSNRYAFSRNFVMLTMTIMVIITIVKSSLALSLGLVGALSIVRYRTAIKEPEELAYTFLAIAIGLGMGADQVMVTVSLFVTIVLVIIARQKIREDELEFVNIRIAGIPESSKNITRLIQIVENNSNGLELKRLNDSSDGFEILLSAVISSYESMIKIKTELSNFDKKISVSFLENMGGV
jgi:hypothetical protein